MTSDLYGTFVDWLIFALCANIPAAYTVTHAFAT